jgi:Transposase domain (DUF772)
MRGSDERAGALFSYVDLEDRVPTGHPLRAVRAIVNQALNALPGDFDRFYGRIGRFGIPPEKLLRALLLQAFYSIRSERQLWMTDGAVRGEDGLETPGGGRRLRAARPYTAGVFWPLHATAVSGA